MKLSFMPYFTIYDPDYKQYAEDHQKNYYKNVIFGVTNPLFLKVIYSCYHLYKIFFK